MDKNREIQKLKDQLILEKKFKKLRTYALTEYLSERLQTEQRLVKHYNSVLNIKYIASQRINKRNEILKNINEITEFTKPMLNSKNLILKRLEKDLDDEELMRNFANSSLFSVKDKLICLFTENLEFLRKLFEDEVKDLKDNFQTQIEKMNKNQLVDINEINICISNLEAKFTLILTNLNFDFNTKMNGNKREHQDKLLTMKFSIQKRISDMKIEYSTMKENYETSYINLKHRQLSEKCSNVTKLIESHAIKIDELIESIRLYEDKFVTLDEKQLTIKTKKEYFKEKFYECTKLKENLITDRSKRHMQLGKLSLESHNAIKKLKSDTSQFEKIIKMLSICSHFEYLQDVTSISPKQKQDDVEKEFPNISSSIDFFNQDFFREPHTLMNRIVAISIEIRSLERENLDLKTENKHLIECCFKGFVDFNIKGNLRNQGLMIKQL